MSSIAISKRFGMSIRPHLSELLYAQDEFMFYLAWTFGTTLLFDTESLTLYRELSNERHNTDELAEFVATHSAQARREVESLSCIRSLTSDRLQPILEGDLLLRSLRSHILGDCNNRWHGVKLLLLSLNPRILILDKYSISIRLLAVLSILSPAVSRRMMFNLKRRKIHGLR